MSKEKWQIKTNEFIGYIKLANKSKVLGITDEMKSLMRLLSQIILNKCGL